jgi:hypothetical protein
MSKRAFVRSYEELKAELNKLGEPPPGHLRVFRGQTARYFTDASKETELLIPHAARSNAHDASSGPIWHSASVELAKWLASRNRVLQSSSVVRLTVASAILQHYGIGSNFLDVTWDLDVALWFAMHRLAIVPDRIRRREGYGGWLATRHAFYEPAAAEAVLYVFDVKPWMGEEIIEHGNLIDVYNGWYGFNDLDDAPMRILAQKASLLAAAFSGYDNHAVADSFVSRLDTVSAPLDLSRDEINLAKHVALICTLAENFEAPDSAGLRRPAQKLFPLPDSDLVYRTLLSIPAIFDPDGREAKAGGLAGKRMVRPADLLEYYSVAPPADEKSAAARTYGQELMTYAGFDSFLDPVLFFPWLKDRENKCPPVTLGSKTFEIGSALPLLLECTWFHDLPVAYPGGANRWNHEELASGIPERIGGHSAANIFFEFGSLDAKPIGVHPESGSVRAVWLCRADNRWVSVVFQYLPNIGDLRISRTIAYSPARQSFDFEDTVEVPDLSGSQKEEFNRIFSVEPMQGLFMGLAILKRFMPGRSRTFAIPAENGGEIRFRHTFKAATLKRFDTEYFIPRDADGHPLSPRRDLIAETQILSDGPDRP